MPSDVVKKVAEALYQQALKTTREEVDQIDFDLKDAIPVFKKLAKESDTGIAVIVAAYLDECLKQLITLRLHGADKNLLGTLFGNRGALGTFSSRMDLARGLNFISAKTYRRVNAIRKIRNDFAHDPFGITFNTEKIKDKVEAFPVDLKTFVDTIRKEVEVRKITKPPSRLTSKEKFLIKSALTLAFMTAELIAFPIARENKVDVSDLLADFDKMPSKLQDLQRDVARCISEIFSK